MVRVRWLGHACFMLKGSKKSVMFDPFKGIGLPEPDIKVDVVLCSHSHADHNNVAPVRHDKSLILEGFVGTKQVNSLSVKGVATFHDDERGSKRGKNSVYVVKLDEVVFCHLGDLGEELSEPQLSEIGSVHVLFVPVGGFYTIGPEEATRVIESIKPRIAVPMHYKIPGMSPRLSSLGTVEEFLGGADNVQRLDGADFEISEKDLPRATSIIVPKFG